MALGAHRATHFRSRTHGHGHGDAWVPRDPARLHAQLVVEARRHACSSSRGTRDDSGVAARDGATAFLGTRLLSSIGRGAYSLYLWHMPVMWLVWFNTQGANVAPSRVACLGIAVVSTLSYRALERPVTTANPRSRPLIDRRSTSTAWAQEAPPWVK